MRMAQVTKSLLVETIPLQIVPAMKPSCAPRLATIREERGEGSERTSGIDSIIVMSILMFIVIYNLCTSSSFCSGFFIVFGSNMM
nr:hypothetical protein [Tanacetum cinerariifolium]